MINRVPDELWTEVRDIVQETVSKTIPKKKKYKIAKWLSQKPLHSCEKNSNAKECSNYCTIALISQASKVMLKILQVRLQQYMNRELPDVQAGFIKAEEPEIKLPTSTGS